MSTKAEEEKKVQDAAAQGVSCTAGLGKVVAPITRERLCRLETVIQQKVRDSTCSVQRQKSIEAMSEESLSNISETLWKLREI